jgi:glutamate/tyrosine decarboxylase-like PLP-dependent enzyme
VSEAFAPLLDTVQRRALAFLDTLSERPAAVVHTPATTPEAAPPLQGMGASAALQCFVERFEAHLSASSGPRYWGFVTGGTTPAALAGDWLASTYDQNLSNDVGSVASAVEREALAGLRALFGLPDVFHGAFVSGATAANTSALATARQWLHAQHGFDSAELGLSGAPPLRVFAGSAHSSIDKALAILGLGRRALTHLPCLPGRTTLDVAALHQALADAGDAPSVVVASAGEVNTGDFDDLDAIATLCDTHNAWLHVDGAFGLFATLSPAHAAQLRGIERAASITVDLHKWLNVPYDSGVVFTRQPQAQRAVYRASSAYLGDTTDPLHYTPENSRRFRALPAWLSLVAYGRSGIAEWVMRDCALAERFGAGIAQRPALQLLDQVRLNIVCFALRDGDAVARDALLERLTRDGRVFLTPTVLFGRPAIRAALSNWRTTEQDVDIALAALDDALRLL